MLSIGIEWMSTSRMAARFDEVLATINWRAVWSWRNSGMTSVNQSVSSWVSSEIRALMPRPTSATSASTSAVTAEVLLAGLDALVVEDLAQGVLDLDEV